MIYWLALGVCTLLTVGITPLIIKLAFKVKALDYQDERKVHSKTMPRLGGLAIYFSFLLGYILFDVGALLPNEQMTSFMNAYLCASSVMVLLGVLDDIFQLSAGMKALAQLLTAIFLVSAGGFVIDQIFLPLLPPIQLGAFGFLFTIAWIVGVTNSINLIDGLDGLSSGITSISFLTVALIALWQGESLIALLSFILLGSTLGFLVHNFHPAKIFMGDTGSLFLGFSVAILSMMGYKYIAFVSFIVPLLMLSVPLFDTLWAICRRLLKGQSPFQADRGHLHHRLLDRQYGHVKTVLILYAISGSFALTALVYTIYSKHLGVLCFLVVLAVLEALFDLTGFKRCLAKRRAKRLEIKEMKETENTHQ